MEIPHRIRLTLPLVALIVLVSACIDDDEVAREREVVPNVTPTALAALPEGVERAVVEVRDGEFTVDELIVQRLEPTVLDLVNHDSATYQLRIGDLLTTTTIAPRAITQLEFTTPSADTYTAELQDEDGTVLATLPVAVIAPGGVDPPNP